jgi:hypothetical protein
LIPFDGIWLEFEIHRTPEDQKILLPAGIMDRVIKQDGTIRVSIRRDKWRPIADLLSVLGIEPDVDSSTRETSLPVEEEEEYPAEPEKGEERESVAEEGGWHGIARRPGIKAQDKGCDESALKASIREEVLQNNHLSELALLARGRRHGRQVAQARSDTGSGRSKSRGVRATQ